MISWIKDCFKWFFGIIFVKGDLDRLKISTNARFNIVEQGLLRIQWDLIYDKSFCEMSDILYQRACELHDRYVAVGGNWYVHNEMDELTVRYNAWKKKQAKVKKK